MTLVSYGRRVTDLAAAQPDAVAFVCEEATLTRSALERDANRRAREFARRGVKAGDLVSLILPNGFEWLKSCLAAWKLGGGCLSTILVFVVVFWMLGYVQC